MLTQYIDLFRVFMSPGAGEAAVSTLYSGYIGQGPKVLEFELALGNYLSSQGVCTVNSGTSAIHLALHLLRKPDDEWPGLLEDDEVLTTPLTCTATNWPILANRLNIRWCDVDSETLNVDLDDVARKLSSRTKIVLIVHWGGFPVDLDRLGAILDRGAETYGFRARVVEDCAHALGSRFRGRSVGGPPNIGCFSFQAIKHVTSVDGGCLLLPTQELHRRGKLCRWYGIDRETERGDFRCEVDVEEWGFKFHMNDLCATIGLENLKHADALIARHQANAAFYDEQLREVSGLKLLNRSSDCVSSFWLYSMLVERRSEFMAKMRTKGIVTSQVHERNDKHTCVKRYRSLLPGLERLIPQLVNIPVGWWVTDDQRHYIAESIREGW
jgi:dTDP-4-amino-4,6-dideoxygalactose transaminase